MDSFKQLFDDEDPVPEHIIRNVEQRIQGSVKPMRFAGDTADLYLNKVGKTFMAFLSGGNNANQPTKKYNGRSAASPTDNDAPPGGKH